MTERHSRGRRPTQRIRTPHSWSWSRRRRMTSRLKPMRKRTSSGTALPVLGREGVGRQVGHADLDRAGHDVEQRGLPRLVALGARQPALVGPAPVAVHDDRRRAAAPGRRGSRAGGRRWGAGTAAGRGSARSPLHHTPRQRMPRSRCHWRKAAVRPLPSRRCWASEVSATAQSPASSARAGRRSRAPGGRARRAARGADRTAGRTWKPRCGPLDSRFTGIARSDRSVRRSPYP